MKIDYPMLDWADVRVGDTVLYEQLGEGMNTYFEFVVTEYTDRNPGTYYLVERPRDKFPEEYGAVIIAKKVRGVEFPEGIALIRHRGSSYHHSLSNPQWKSVGMKVAGADNHGEKHIEDWVLAQIVPVEENK